MLQSVVTENDGHRGWRHEGAVVTGCATPKERALRVCARPMSVPGRRKGLFGIIDDHSYRDDVDGQCPRSIVPFSGGKPFLLLFALLPD